MTIPLSLGAALLVCLAVEEEAVKWTTTRKIYWRGGGVEEVWAFAAVLDDRMQLGEEKFDLV